jgi:RimJ/RimL family protein N-acetyltransferase
LVDGLVLLEGREAFIVSGGVLTERLRLVPIGLEQVAELVAIHRDPWIAEWYAGEWTAARAAEFALACARGWSVDGVGKWIAYDRRTGELVGRGGLSCMAPGAVRLQVAVLAGSDWAGQSLELGWAVREEFRGRGLATEIGRAGLGFAFGALGAPSVISFTERHNWASRKVMERLGMQLAGEIRASGLIEGEPGERDDAPFALYGVARGGDDDGGLRAAGSFGADVGG